MTFFNWNLMNPTIPTFYTYILQPSVTPLTVNLPTIQLGQELKGANDIFNQHIVVNNNNIQPSFAPITLGLPTIQLSTEAKVAEAQNVCNQQILNNHITPYTSMCAGIPTLQLNREAKNVEICIKQTNSSCTNISNEIPKLPQNRDVKNADIFNFDNVPIIHIKEECVEEQEQSTKNWPIVTVKEEPELDHDKKLDFDVPEIAKTEEDWSEVPIKEETNMESKEHKIDHKNDENRRKKHRTPQNPKLYTCDHCSYQTNWKGNLTKHVVSRHTAFDEINWLKCEHCPYKGKTKDYLKCHLLHVHNISVKWYTCSHCPFKAKQKCVLDRHVIVNHTESEEIEWFSCDHCSYKAKFRTNLKQHMLSKHTESNDIKWFQCSYCKFKAKRKRNLKWHQINKHTAYDKILWFQCELCSCKFKRRPALRLHVATCHNGQGVKSKNSKPLTREIPVFIDSKLCWRRVVAKETSEGENFKCTQCDFVISDKELFKKHVLKKHTVTELKKEDDCIVKKTYKTKDVTVLVNHVPCVRKVIDHPLSQE